MTAPLYLLDTAAAEGLGLSAVTRGSLLVLDGDEGRHAATVRRTRPGERVDVTDGAGALARCVATEVAPARVVLEVISAEWHPPSRPELILVQALAKGGRDELAIETATELGVDRVVPWQAARSVVVWSGERGRRAHGKWGATVRTAVKQSRRARVPEVGAAITSAGLVGWVGARVSGGGLVLVLHEEAAEALTGLLPGLFPDLFPGPRGDPEEPEPARPASLPSVTVIVGPEGGITSEEVAALEAAGAHSVRLGPHVLRSSTAGPAALAALSVMLGRW